MPEVYRDDQRRFSFPWPSFLRASSLHVGAAAAAASLRRDLVDTKTVDPHVFDEAFAVSRVTPGTNLLALYVVLGRSSDGWRGALTALALGTIVPALVACGIAGLYAHFESAPVVAAMRGARAGALAVLLWAAVRLLRPQLAHQRGRGAVLVIGAAVMALMLQLPPIMILLVSGAAGAFVLRGQS